MRRAVTRSIALVCGSILGGALEVFAQVPFAAPVPIGPNLDQVRQAIVADMDGDGLSEVVLGSSGMGSVISARIEGGAIGSYRHLLPVTVNGMVMTVADVNGDGAPDILRGAISEETGYQYRGLYIHHADGQGGYLPPERFAAGLWYNSAWVADLDGDGRKEVVAFRTGSIDVYQRDQPGSAYLPIAAFPIGGFGGVFISDFNGDGVDDLLFASTSSGAGSIKLWMPAAGAAAPIQIGNFNSISSQDILYADDVNGDGATDLIAQDFNNGASQTFKIWLNSGDGTFTTLAQQVLGAPMPNFKLARFAGEPWPRFVQARSGHLFATPLLPSLQLGNTDTLAIARTTDIWTLADVDDDGHEDLLLNDEDRLQWLKGPLLQGPPYAPQELFSWPHRTYCGLTVIEGDDGGEQAAFISGMSAYRNDVFFVRDANGTSPLVRAGLDQSTWLSQPKGRLLQTDLDRDGDHDLVGFLDQGYRAQVFSLENAGGAYVHRGHGTALAPSGLSDYFSFDAINLFDTDDDGSTDLLLSGAWRMHGPNSSFVDPRTYRLRQTGPFQFPEADSPYPGTECFGAGDMNSDGWEDRLRYVSATNSTRVELSNGDGTYSSGPSMPGCFTGRWADIDGDGRKELLHATNAGLFARRTEGGVFQEEFLLAQFDGYPQWDVADVNRDGFLEVALSWTGFNPSRTVVELLIGDGQFPIAHRDTIYDGPQREVRFIDLDRNGFPDLYLQRGACIYLMKNLSVPLPPPEQSLGTFTVYPNPASGSIQLDLGYEPDGPVDIEVFAVTGQVVRQRVQLAFKEWVDLYGLSSGAYIVTAWDKGSGARIGSARFVVGMD